MVDSSFRVQLDGASGARLGGELDFACYDRAVTELAPLFEATNDVSLDLSDLSFVDSSGIRLFIQLHQAVREHGGLILRSPTAHVARILDIAGLPQMGVRVVRRDA
jgi:anti-anti-sigma factor